LFSLLRWREKDLPFGLAFSRSTLDEYFSSVCPLSHYQSIHELVRLTSPTVTDGQIFPHRQALIAALNFHSRKTNQYYSYEASSTSTPLSSAAEGAKDKSIEELPIVIDTGASWSVTPHLSDFSGPIKPAAFAD
jgi:hypothetical protein